MWTRRIFLKKGGWTFLCFFFLHSFSFWKWIPTAFAKAKQILPKGFSKRQLMSMNPEEVDNRNLEIDPLDQFGTMGPTDVAVDLNSYRLKLTGKVGRPLSLSYDQILMRPSLTESVLLICPGFFANNGRWTGVDLKGLFQEAQVHPEAQHIDIIGAHEKWVRIPLNAIHQKKIFLAYRVNGEPLPQKHGFPLRLVYEDAYGFDWVKYVEEIVVL
jgi:sulfoxide reductase catalytic subunit YedY